MREKFYVFLFFLLAGLQIAVAQTLDVSGVVIDDGGDPIIGASVLVKGTTKGTVTGIDGDFRLQGVRTNDVLVVSYIGMRKLELAPKAQMRITLQSEDEQLDEIIVTAFGQAKKSAFTGSATVINSEKLEQKQVTNVLQSLAGEVAGLQIDPSTSPGSTSSILIRGKGSINAGTDPLIIVDGMPYDGGWNNINPSDVESVTVLKDAASNALYGARGANGVIIVTTKKGAAGKATVSLDAKWGFNTRGSRDYDRITNPGQYYEMYYKALYNSYVAKGMTATAAHQLANTNLFGDSSVGGLGYNVYAVPEGELLIGTNGKLNPNATLGNRISRNGQVYTLMPDDWTDETYETGMRQEYNVSISGGNNQSQMYSSFGYLKDEGIVAASDYERFSGRLRASYQVRDWLNFGANVGYVHTNQKSAAGSSDSDGTYLNLNVFAASANMAPIYPLYVRDANGNILTDANGKVFDWGDGAYNALDANGDAQVRPNNTSSNPINSRLVDFNSTVGNSINADTYVDISFLNDFKFTFKAGTTVWETKNSAGSNPYYGYYVSSGGVLSKTDGRTTTLNLQQLLNWNHNYGVHHLSALVGHESYQYKYEYLNASKSGALDFSGNRELNSYLNSPYIPYSYATNYNTEGYFFRGMYDYDERYFGQISFRRDASSRFNPKHRWGNFYSVGGAWIISKEDWFNVKWINTLKLKVSYGEQGNDQIGYYRYTDLYQVDNVNGDLALSFYSKGNKDVTWETNRNFNFGFEFDLLKNRMGGSIEFYNRATSDMLLWYSTPATLGYTGYYKNVGDMRNQGIELTLQGSPIRTKNIDWNLNLNVTYNNQKVTYMPDSNKSMTVDGYEGYQSGTNYFVGEGLPLGTFYIAKYAGVSETGQSQWYRTVNGEETVTTNYSEATMHIVKAQRPLYGGFGTSLKIKNFDLAAQFTYSLGGKGYDSEYAFLMTVPTSSATGYALHKDLLNAWSTENTSSNIPRWQYGDTYTGVISDRYLISNSYLSFQNMQIGYNLPKQAIRAMGLTKLRVFVSGDNLYLWSKRKGYDPRVSSGYGTYSPMRTISGGVSIQF
jgi:TonB-linked SusC/RagA family outer membrane protein